GSLHCILSAGRNCAVEPSLSCGRVVMTPWTPVEVTPADHVALLYQEACACVHALSIYACCPIAGLLENVTDLAFRFMSLRQLLFPFALLLAMLSAAATTSDTPIDTARTETMSTMHDAMHDVQLTGKPDIDFARLMIPHHQGAIDMAKVELLFGT